VRSVGRARAPCGLEVRRMSPMERAVVPRQPKNGCMLLLGNFIGGEGAHICAILINFKIIVDVDIFGCV
jgi:hypothetical protein